MPNIYSDIANSSDRATQGYFNAMATKDRLEANAFNKQRIERQDAYADEERNYKRKEWQQSQMQQAVQDAAEMYLGDASNDEVMGYLSQAAQQIGVPPPSASVLAQIRGKVAGTSGGQAYGTVVYGRDAQGNTVALQPTKNGTFVAPKVPDGVQITNPVKFLNQGDQFAAIDPRNPTQPLARIPINLGPNETPDYKAEVKTAEKDAENAAKKKAGFPKIRDNIASMESNVADVKSAIAKARAVIDRGRAAGWWSLAGGIPETEAKKLRAYFKTIQANVGFNYLAEMRQNSPTGGAVGNLTEREFDLLAATAGTLDPELDAETLTDILVSLEKAQDRALGRVRGAFETDYPDAVKTPVVKEGF